MFRPELSPSPGLWRGTVGAWLLTESLRDLSDLNHDVVDNLGATFAPSRFGKVRSFDGSADALQIAASSTLNTPNGNTIACLLKRTGTQVQWATPVGRSLNDEAASPFVQYTLQANSNADDDLRYAFGREAGSALAIATGGGTILDNTWYLVIGGVDIGGGQVFIWHGEPGTSPTQNSSGFSAPGIASDATDDLYIGAYHRAGSVQRFWNGDIAYAMVWNRPLLESEVVSLYADAFLPFRQRRRRVYGLPVAGGALQGTGTIAATAAVSGAATARRNGAGTIVIDTAVTGAATVTRQGAGTIASVLTMSGAATATRQGAGTIGAVVTITGNATLASLNPQGTGTVAIATTMSGAATRRRSAAGTISASMTMIGAATQISQAFGTITITVTISGAAGEDGPDVVAPRPSFIKSRGRVFGRSAQGQVGRRRGNSTAGTR